MSARATTDAQTTPSIPKVGRLRPLKLPPVADETLRNGLRVIAVRRPTIPRVEVRARIPAGLARDGRGGTRARLLPETLLAGTESYDSVALARELQRLGASLEAHADSDDLLLSGGTLSATLPGLLDVMSEVLRRPTFPADEVTVARERVAQELLIQRSQPQALAGETLANRLFGRHPYGRRLPDPEVVRRLGRASVAGYHEGTVTPRGSTIVLVGDLQPKRAIEQVAEALGTWRSSVRPERLSTPVPPEADPTVVIVNRPGAVQTNIRLGAFGLPRSHPDYFRLALANMVFGGYFTSRLTTNIREDKGYTYGGNSVMTQRRAAATISVGADVRSEVTAAALMEIRYELSRMIALPVTQQELDDARQYLSGITALSVQTQAGLATYVDSLAAVGLDLSFLRNFRAGLDAVELDDVLRLSRTHLAPGSMVTVMVGDAAAIAEQVAPLAPTRVLDA